MNEFEKFFEKFFSPSALAAAKRENIEKRLDLSDKDIQMSLDTGFWGNHIHEVINKNLAEYAREYAI